MTRHPLDTLHLENSVAVVREIGITSIFALVWLNGVLAMLQSAVGAAYGAAALGLVLAFAAAALTYTLAQLMTALPNAVDTLPTVIVAVMIFAPILLLAASLICFLVGLAPAATAGP